MKIRRLAETDLARFCVMPKEKREQALRKHKSGWAPHDYDPVRLAQPDILNRQLAMFGATSPTPWRKIKELIVKASDGPKEAYYNLKVGEALFEFARLKEIISRDHALPSWGVGFGQSVRYWQNYVSIFDRNFEISFHDYRISKNLNEAARRFVLSVMHQRTRVVDPDLQESVLAIYQFAKGSNGKRIIRRFTDEGIDLFTFEELNEMISDTYSLWQKILNEREADVRKTGTGPSNPMGF